jgi:hypothetical protein
MNASLLKKAVPHLVAIAVFLIVAIMYGKPALDGKVVSQSDVVEWKGAAQQSFEFREKYGHFPLWTESTFSGMPAYSIALEASSKIATGYLSYLVTFGLPKPICFFFLACICFYILTQVLRINPWIGILSALAYGYATFNPILVAVGHETELYAIGYAPAVIASVLLIYQRYYLSGAALLAIFFGFQISTQHVQIIYYTGIMLAFMTIAFLIKSYKEKTLKAAFTGMAIALVAGLIGLGTYAISLLPLQEYSKETMRGARTDLTNLNQAANTKSGLNKDYAFAWSYGIPETFTLIVPGIYGGGSDGTQISSNSKFAEKAAELGMSEENGLRMANVYAYWGAQQQGTSGPVYLGAVICFLFILGAVYAKSWHKGWILSAAILGILMAWGKNFSVFNYFLFDHLPFYNKFRSPTIALVMPQLVFPLLAAIGLDQLISTKEPKQISWQKLKTTFYITGGLLILLAVFYFSADFKGQNDNNVKENFNNQILQSTSRGKQPSPEMIQQANEISTGLIKGLQADRQGLFGFDLLRSILLIGIAALLVGLYLKEKIKPLMLVGGLILLSGYDLLAEGRVYLSEDNFLELNDSEASFTPTAADIQISKDPDKNFRVFDQAVEQGFTNDSRVSYHFNSIGGYSPAKLGLYQDIIEHQLSKGNLMVFNMLNTKYFIQRNPSTGQQVARVNPAAFGPCWFVRNIHFVKDGDEEMKALDSINVHDTAIVQRKFEKSIEALPVFDSSARLSLIENLNDKITYRSSAKTNQFAVFSEVYYDKGWNAYIDGKKSDYCKVDYILRGISVPPGDHTIEFRFEPGIIKLANTITVSCSIIAYLLLLSAVFVIWRKKDQPV